MMVLTDRADLLGVVKAKAGDARGLPNLTARVDADAAEWPANGYAEPALSGGEPEGSDGFGAPVSPCHCLPSTPVAASTTTNLS